MFNVVNGKDIVPRLLGNKWPSLDLAGGLLTSLMQRKYGMHITKADLPETVAEYTELGLYYGLERQHSLLSFEAGQQTEQYLQAFLYTTKFLEYHKMSAYRERIFTLSRGEPIE